MSRELDREIGVKVMGDKPSKREGMIYNPLRYSSDLNAAHEVEEKIKEMGLITAYIAQLGTIVTEGWDFDMGSDNEETFLITHASAEDRCRAALAAVEGKR